MCKFELHQSGRKSGVLTIVQWSPGPMEMQIENCAYFHISLVRPRHYCDKKLTPKTKVV